MSNLLHNGKNVIYEFYKTIEFEEWFNEQPLKSKMQIEERLLHIATEGHFGIYKRLTEFIWELKWASGRRLYYTYLAKYNILLLLGGNKNGQSKDIKQAEKILRKYTETSP